MNAQTRRAVLAGAVLAAAAAPAFGQGCVPTGQSGLMLSQDLLRLAPSPAGAGASSDPSGAGGTGAGPVLDPGAAYESDAGPLRLADAALTPYLRPRQLELGVSYRWLTAARPFVGTSEDKALEDAGRDFVNHTNLVDLSLTAGLTPRWSVTASLPYVISTRHQPVVANGTVIDQDTTRASGNGDLRVVGKAWLGAPAAYPDHNVQLGLGVKVPTGSDKQRDTFKTATGPAILPVDQSIQPGDGGWGLIAEVSAFQRIVGRTTAYATGSYLFNPQDTGAATGFAAPNSVASIYDQYVARLGVAQPVWPRGLVASLGGRLEGVPVHDALGPSDGFRRPGYAVSVEPGLAFSIWRTTLGISTPVAVHRERQASVTDVSRGVHGDGSFYDYAVIASFSYRLN